MSTPVAVRQRLKLRAARLVLRLARLRPRRRTIRFRMTLTYAGLFLLAGIVMIGVTYVLMQRATGHVLVIGRWHDGPTLDPARLGENAARQRAADLKQLLVQSGIALAISTVVAFGLGWLLAGRALRPLREMVGATRQISQHNLHQRLVSSGPDDEVTDLTRTINALLSRLDHAFEAQRRFVANASHELRTPLTWDRTLIEVTLADPDASVGALQAGFHELLVSNEEQERLIDALLTLAATERGIDHCSRIDLADIAAEAALQRQQSANDHQVTIHLELSAAPLDGNPELIKRLVGNLVDNAIAYNRIAGSVDIITGWRNGAAHLTVANTGDIVPQSEIDRLTEPFQRLDSVRTHHHDGHGLGLSIVQAIVTAHRAHLAIVPGPAGGLSVTVLSRKSI